MSSTTTTVNVKLKISPVSNHFFNSFPNIKITVSSHGDFFQIIVDGGKHVVFIAHKLNYISKINKLAKLRRHASFAKILFGYLYTSERAFKPSYTFSSI